MSTTGVLLLTLALLTAGIGAVLVALSLSSMSGSRQARRAPLRHAATSAIVAVLATEERDMTVALEHLSQLTRAEAVTVILDIAPSLNGSSLTVLRHMAEQVDLLSYARKNIASKRWAKRLYAARILTALGADSYRLPALLQDGASEVRAQGAVWASLSPGEAEINLLIGMLDDSDGLCRFEAQTALIRIGLPAVPDLVEALSSANEPVAERAMAVAAAIGDERFTEAVVKAAGSTSPSMRAGAAAALVGIGDPASERLLVDLLADEAADVRRACATGLAKLGYWPACPEIESLLDDNIWEVRRDAALALSSLGAPGRILLRDNARSKGRRAELADQVLQLATTMTGSVA